jgi:hypothetical protein
MKEADPARIGEEIEALVAALSALGDSPARAQAQELVRLLISLYGAGLARMLDLIRTEGGGPDAVLERFAADPLLASLLAVHDLHPHPIEVRVRRALAGLQPHLPPSTRVTLAAVAPDSVRVTVERPAAGQAGHTIRMAIERAVQEAAPELTAIQVEGLEAPLIQIVRSAAVASGQQIDQ